MYFCIVHSIHECFLLGKIDIWMTPERKAIKIAFREQLQQQKLPTNAECREVIAKFRALNNRSVNVVKAYVNNEIRRKKCGKR